MEDMRTTISQKIRENCKIGNKLMNDWLLTINIIDHAQFTQGPKPSMTKSHEA